MPSAKLPALSGTLGVRTGTAEPLGAASEDQGAIEIGGRLCSHVLYLSAPVGAQIVIAQAVCLTVDDLLQPRLQLRPLGRIHFDLEDRILHTLAEVAAGLRHAAQPCGPLAVVRGNVIGHQHQHGSLPEPGRIGIEIAAQMPRKKLRLKIRHEPEWRIFLQEGMAALLALALLPGGKHGLARLFREKDSTTVLPLEVAGPQLAAVDERQRQPVGKHRPELLHQVERKARPSGPVAMEKAHRRVQPHAFAGAAAVVHEQGVEEGKKRVYGIERRPSRTPGPAHLRVGRADQVTEHGEIYVGRLALGAAQPVRVLVLAPAGLRDRVVICAAGGRNKVTRLLFGSGSLSSNRSNP